ncbi:MAG: hypothetical protein OEY75_06695 [Hylemonella sp.]|nr:hypothetical protein [Hylemonella sp.]MDH5708787.1 hypothetical protein [Hylemonella sp.]
MYKSLHHFLIVCLLGLLSLSSSAQQVSKEQIKGLDEQVQDIKKDVLAISAELMQLEEKLIYPSNTQVSIFVSFAQKASFRLDAIKIRIDGKDVAHHIYTFKELEALKGGGVQRIHTGNIRNGEHVLEVTVIGKTSSDADYQQVATYKINKTIEPKLVEVHVAGPGASGQAIEFKD